MRPLRFVIAPCAAVFALVLLASSATAKEIQVNCTDPNPAKHDSVQSALADKAEPLTITITGWCNEHVVIRRAVTLKGADPALDGIEGPAAGADLGLVQVLDTKSVAAATPLPSNQAVYFESLGIRNSDNVGLFTAHASVGLQNVHITDNASDGGSFTFDSFVVALGSHFSNNGLGGVHVRRAAVFQCGQCEFEDNLSWQATAAADGIIYVYDGSTVSGVRGARAINDGNLVMDAGTSVTATVRALVANSQGDVEVYGVAITGPVTCGVDGRYVTENSTQAGSVGLNYFYAGCNFFAAGTEVFTNHTLFEGPVQGVSYGDITFSTLECTGGGEMVCYGTSTKVSSSCGLCP